LKKSPITHSISQLAKLVTQPIPALQKKWQTDSKEMTQYMLH